MDEIASHLSNVPHVAESHVEKPLTLNALFPLSLQGRVRVCQLTTYYLLLTSERKESIMAENVYKVIELVGTSNESWEKAAGSRHRAGFTDVAGSAGRPHRGARRQH